MGKVFYTLYKQTSGGAIQQWNVASVGNQVVTEYGLKDGKLQRTVDVVKAGKNTGKKNATTPEEQAAAQAQQMYDAKLKKGYVRDLAHAQSTKNTLAGIVPMLAFPIEKKPKAVVFPALAQPKLDGMRCIAIIKDGKAKLWSRTQKPIDGHTHIVAALEALTRVNAFGTDGIILDGELYDHALKDNFNELMHRATGEGAALEYHVYDVAGSGTWAERTERICALNNGIIKVVDTVQINSREELHAYQIECIERGYEGCMYRNPGGAYENKRSVNLLKVKTFIDEEFEIVGIDEGAGKLMGCAGTINVVTKKGVIVKPAPIGGLALQKWYWEHKAEIIGKRGTVKHFGQTPDGSLRFPKFKCVREE